MDITVIFEDKELVVVNKPAGVIVYPDGKHDYPALSTWLEERYGKDNFYFVHRIDRETSGVLLVARSKEAHEFLKEQFKNREIQKTYRAFVYGAFKEERGVIDKPIGSSRGGGPRSAKQPHGVERDALTLYKVLQNGKDASYIEVFPKTGRTHQIRVHMSAVQHPIVADSLYARSRAPILGFTRLALHALSLKFTHSGGKVLEFTAPLPEDFAKAVSLLNLQK